MERERISVVIPCYNRRDRILASVESVLGQSYEALELIVVDDGSTDGSAELFENYTDKRLRFLRYEENRGACYARNYGAERATGEYLAFQDSDDVWHRDKLEKQLRHTADRNSDKRHHHCQNTQHRWKFHGLALVAGPDQIAHGAAAQHCGAEADQAQNPQNAPAGTPVLL